MSDSTSVRVYVRLRPDRKCLQLAYTDPLTGKVKTKSADTTDWKEAERAAAVWQEELFSERPMTDPSWEQFRLRFTDEYLSGKCRNTVMAYKKALNSFELHIGKVRALSHISPGLFSQYQAKLGKKVKITTVGSHSRHLRAALRWAEHMEMIRRAPRIVIPKTGRRRLARSRAVTLVEYQKMKEAIPSWLKTRTTPAEVAAWERFLDLLWLSGLRIEEAMKLSWDEPPIQVDLDGGKYPRLIVFGEAQKSREDELMIIAPDFDAWLRQTSPRNRSGLVAPLGDCSRSRASHAIAEIGEAAMVVTGPDKFASAHDFRRAFATRWAAKVRPFTLQRMMRHKTLQTTLSFYLDVEASEVGSEVWSAPEFSNH